MHVREQIDGIYALLCRALPMPVLARAIRERIARAEMPSPQGRQITVVRALSAITFG